MKIVINHLTRFQSGYLCMAGVDVHTRQHVRPIPIRAHLRPALLASEGGPLDMGSILELGPTKSIAQVPQVEDHEFDLKQMKSLGVLAGPRFWNMVTQMAQARLKTIFGPDLKMTGKACAVALGKGTASLGCLIPSAPPELYLRSRPDKPAQIRLRVSDGEFDLDLGVTDIRLYGPDHMQPDPDMVKTISARLATEETILSVGLTRPFTPSPDMPPAHWLQVNNIHFRAPSQDRRSRESA